MPKRDDPTTLVSVRLKKKNKKLLKEVLQALGVLLAMAIFFGLAYACDDMLNKDESPLWGLDD